jgi:hypothetical protein
LQSCQRITPTFPEFKGSDDAFRGRLIQKSNHGGIAMLFCLTVNYLPKSLAAMSRNPNTNRREAVEQLVTAAGCKLIAMYGAIADGPGAMVIFDADPVAAPAMTGVAAASDGLQNVKMQRLLSADEVVAVRKKRAEIQGSFRTPGSAVLPTNEQNPDRDPNKPPL